MTSRFHRALHQFLLLLWKNYLLLRRKKMMLILQMAVPAIFASLLIILRRVPHGVSTPKAVIWNSFSIDQVLNPDHGCVIYYAPNVTDKPSRQIMEGALKRMKNIKGAHGFDSEMSLMKELMKKLEEEQGMFNWSSAEIVNNNSCLITSNLCHTKLFRNRTCRILAAVVFEELPDTRCTKSPGFCANDSIFRYKLRFPSTLRTSVQGPGLRQGRWNTDVISPITQKDEPRDMHHHGGPPDYKGESFLTLQHSLDLSIIDLLTNGNASYGEMFSVKMEKFPYPPYKVDAFHMVMQTFFPFLIMLGFLLWVMMIIKDIVHEKELKLKESMRMMGLNTKLHWLTWFLCYLLTMIISVSLETCLLVKNIGAGGPVVSFTSPTLLCFFLMSYAVATIAFCFCVSTFFSKANSATILGGLTFFMQYIPYFYLQPYYDSMSWPEKAFSCLLANIAMAFGIQVIGEFESARINLNWTTINESAFSDGNFTLLYVLCILWLDALFYIVFALYIDMVFPGDYGIPKKCNFFFQMFCKKSGATEASKELVQNEIESQDDEHQELEPLMNQPAAIEEDFEQTPKDNFESEPTDLSVGIRLIHLTKEFCIKSEKRQAVNNLTLNMYEGHVTVLLGHNGAGKTTTFSILTGLIPPTSGTAFVAGFDITTSMEHIHQILGVCPQNSVLFESLTVEEHLTFFNKLRHSVKANDEVVRMMAAVDLLDKRNSLAKTLSGGMMRKLSVGIAFIGGSKVVILDEPTSGLDPHARQKVWELIRSSLPGRTILVSTHCMEEAEALGDRIAIMVNGVVKCCGSSMFLKGHFGDYHRLAVSGYSDCNIHKVTEFVRSYIPEIEVKRLCDSCTSYLLPNNRKQKFHELFEGIEGEKEELRIADYGLSSVSLEEVFLRINHSLFDHESDVHSLLNENSLQYSENLPSVKFRCFNHHLARACQFFAMLQKKALQSFHSCHVSLFQLLIPLVIIGPTIAFLERIFLVQESPSLHLKLNVFSDPSIVYGIFSKQDKRLVQFLAAYTSAFDSNVKLVDVSDHTLERKPCRPVRKILISEGRKSLQNYRLHFPIALCVSRSNVSGLSMKATAFFNDEMLHTAPVSLNALDNGILRYATNDSKKWMIQVTNHPFPKTSTESLEDMALQGLEGYAIVFSILFGISFLVSGFVLFLIRERVVGVKRCQLLSGGSAWSFWWSAILWDLFFVTLSCLLIIFCFWFFHLKSFTEEGRWLVTLLLFVVYGWGILPVTYFCASFFAVSSSGFLWIMISNIFFIVLGSFVELLDTLRLDAFNLVATLDWLLHLMPNYCLFKGLLKIHVTYNNHAFCQRREIKKGCSLLLDHPCCPASCKRNCLKYSDDLLTWNSRNCIGKELLFLGAWGAAYFTLLILIDEGYFRYLRYRFLLMWNRTTQHLRCCYATPGKLLENEDVAAERMRIVETSRELLIATDPIVLQDLSKRFGRFTAVDQLSIGIGRGECFGLLGVNGAGKTTIFRLLVGDEVITSGDAFMCSQDVKRNIPNKIGFCPQSDALIDELTGRELLVLFAFLRMIKCNLVHLYVQELIDCLLLDADADKLTKLYSGGTKRKLNAALALIGWPMVILLDEPSTGMDPIARRHLWNVLLKLRDLGRTILLSTHSMDECETLCDRIGILVNGRLQCLGNSQHLKSCFGKGFQVSVKFCSTQNDVQKKENINAFKEFLETKFSELTFKVANDILLFDIAAKSTTLSQLLRVMENMRSEFLVEDYSVTQATLQEIFIDFAEEQTYPEQKNSWKKLCKC